MDLPRTLDRLSPGRTGRILSLDTTGPLRRRLLDLGFLPGAAVAALQEGPWGDPVAYGVLGSVVALRRCDAAAIHITESEASHG